MGTPLATLTTLAALIAVTGCTPTCEDVASHGARLEAWSPSEVREVRELCKESMSGKMRKCISDAKTSTDIEICFNLHSLREPPRQDATCEAVGAHVIAMARKELSGMDGDMKEMAEAMLGPLKDEIVKKCREEKWSTGAMNCMVAATNEQDFEECERMIDGANVASCEAVGSHVTAMARKELSGMDGDMKEMAEAMLGPLKDEIVKKCREEKWSEAARRCMVEAKTEQSFERCEGMLETSESKKSLAKDIVKQLAYEAYPRWSADNPRHACPSSLNDLLVYLSKQDTKDPWGNNYVMLCGDRVPQGARGDFAVLSPGPDGKKGTNDDITSWSD
jgi:hypothetical protein